MIDVKKLSFSPIQNNITLKPTYKPFMTCHSFSPIQNNITLKRDKITSLMNKSFSPIQNNITLKLTGFINY